MRTRTALDEVAQMMGGLAYMTGPPGRPLRAGASVIDVTGGMFGVIGMLAALEERHRTGRGQKVVASLFETTAYLVGQHMAQFAVTGKPAAPMPARVSAWAIYDVFETQDEPVFIGVVTDALWEKFCALFALDELWADESLRANNQRVLARERILPQIRALDRRDDPRRGCRQARWHRNAFRADRQARGPVRRSASRHGGLEAVTLDSGAGDPAADDPAGNGRQAPRRTHCPAPPGADARAVLAGLGYDAARSPRWLRPVPARRVRDEDNGKDFSSA